MEVMITNFHVLYPLFVFSLFVLIDSCCLKTVVRSLEGSLVVPVRQIIMVISGLLPCLHQGVGLGIYYNIRGTSDKFFCFVPLNGMSCIGLLNGMDRPHVNQGVGL